jgi:hypothetical protein
VDQVLARLVPSIEILATLEDFELLVRVDNVATTSSGRKKGVCSYERHTSHVTEGLYPKVYLDSGNSNLTSTKTLTNFGRPKFTNPTLRNQNSSTKRTPPNPRKEGPERLNRPESADSRWNYDVLEFSKLSNCIKAGRVECGSGNLLQRSSLGKAF